jgi:hypothetical protein
MPKGFLIKTALFKYDLIWKMVMPFLRLNGRLAGHIGDVAHI